ncbi:MAG: lyase family protein [Acidimicrobiales bacterium]
MNAGAAELFGDQTRLAVENFPISGVRFPLAVIHEVARIKKAAALVLTDLVPDRLPGEMARAIERATDEVLDGKWDDQFVVDVFQTGSATSSHMNVNEVLAARAEELLPGTSVHPNDHVNLGQSSNDVMPSAVRLAAVVAAVGLRSALLRLERELGLQERNLKHVVKAGRTHLQDAVPVTLGQEFGGYRQQIADAGARIEEIVPAVGRLPLGGTAVGNGLNAPPGFADRAIEALADATGLHLTPAPDRFAVQGSHDDLVDLSARARTVAVAMQKISNDIRLMASGPTAGLGELRIPALQPGSSIMPGKVNPVVIEVVNQVVARVIGNDATIAFAGTQGILELNTYLPVIAHDLLDSLQLLTAAADLLASKCVAPLQPDVERCRAYAADSAALVTALAPLIGYDAAADAHHRAQASGESIVDLVARRHDIDASVLEAELDLLTMAQGSIEVSRPELPFEKDESPSVDDPPSDTGTIGPKGP